MPNKSSGKKVDQVRSSPAGISASEGIVSRQGVCGGRACIDGTRIPIWVLERARQLGATETKLLEMYPDLSLPELANAWRYVDSHRDEIEQQIRENEDF